MRSMLLASFLLALIALPAAAVASQPATDATSSLRNLPVSSGVIEPRMVHYEKTIPAHTTQLFDQLGGRAKVVLELHVNKAGKAHSVRVIQSDDPTLNAPIVAAVRQAHWQPGRLDERAIPFNVHLTVKVRD